MHSTTNLGVRWYIHIIIIRTEMTNGTPNIVNNRWRNRALTTFCLGRSRVAVSVSVSSFRPSKV